MVFYGPLCIVAQYNANMITMRSSVLHKCIYTTMLLSTRVAPNANQSMNSFHRQFASIQHSLINSLQKCKLASL